MTRLILALFFALCVSMFAVINVTPAPIHYLFGVSSVPLVLIILGAACFGGLIVGLLGAVGHFRWRRENRQLKEQISELQSQLPSVTQDEDVYAEPIDEDVSEVLNTTSSEIVETVPKSEDNVRHG